MKKYVLLVLALLFLASCGTNQGIGGDLVQGTESVNLGFYELPKSVRSDQSLEVTVEVANRGAEHLRQGDLRLCISGYDPHILPFSNQCQTAPELEAKGTFAPEGSQIHYITWKTGINLPSTVEVFNQEIRVSACYRYRTTANPTICIDPQVAPGRSTKCTFSVKDLGSSQGAPVAVTSVDREVSDGRLTLKVSFENKGGGIPFATGLDACNSLDMNSRDTLTVSRVMIGQTALSCRPQGTIRLTNGKGFVLCEGPVTQQSYYVSPLTIVLDYNYRKEISANVDVVRRV